MKREGFRYVALRNFVDGPIVKAAVVVVGALIDRTRRGLGWTSQAMQGV